MKITKENLYEKGFINSRPEEPYDFGTEYWTYLRKILALGDILVMINKTNELKKIGLISEFYTPRSRFVEDTREYVEFLKRSLGRQRRKLKKEPHDPILNGRIEFIKDVIRELKSYDA